MDGCSKEERHRHIVLPHSEYRFKILHANYFSRFYLFRFSQLRFSSMKPSHHITSLESTMLLCQPLPSFRHFLLFRHRYGSHYHRSSCLLLVSLKPRRSSSTTTSSSSLWMWNSQNTMSMNNGEIISSFATHPLHQEHIQWLNPSLLTSGATPALAATQSSLRSSSPVPFPVPNTNNPTSANISLHITNHYYHHQQQQQQQQQQQLRLDDLMQHIPFAIQRRKQQNIPIGSNNDPIVQLLRYVPFVVLKRCLGV
jgi:hypothetical protein